MEFLHVTLTGWVALSIALSMLFLAALMFVLGNERYQYIWGVFCVAIAIWGFGFYMVTKTMDPIAARLWWQVSYIGTILNPFLYFHFTLEFITSAFFKRFRWFILAVLYTVAGLFIYLNFATNLFVNKVTFIFGQIYWDTPPGALYLYFLSLFLLLIAGSLYLIAREFRVRRNDSLFRQQAIYFFIASAVAYVGGSMNFLPIYGIEVNPTTNFAVAFGALLIAYAILKRGLFEIRIVTAQFLTLILAVFALIRLFVSSSIQEFIFNVVILAVTLALGVYLILSVRREVQQRELIEKQEKELERVNERQENLLHFISHEVKGYFTKSSAAFAGIVEGDYGAVSPEVQTLSTQALAEMHKGVETVVEILEAGDFKKGTVALAHEPFDLKAAVEKTIADFKKTIEEKHLELTVSIEDGTTYTIVGDEPQLRKHVIANLIDNAIKYTPKGSVAVSLSRKGDRILFSVRDSGVGITPEDKQRLFTEGGRGAESVKVNVHSTGYGLFIAKSIVEQHGGRISAESEGKDKGSTFFVELPAKK